MRVTVSIRLSFLSTYMHKTLGTRVVTVYLTSDNTVVNNFTHIFIEYSLFSVKCILV